MKFTKAPAGNYISYINEKDYVSFNGNLKPIETALKINGSWYIVYGDLRNELKKVKIKEEVIEVFKNTNFEYSSRSTLNINEL